VNYKLLFFFAFTLVLAGTVFSLSDTNLVSYYKVDETSGDIIDYVGYDQNASNNGGVQGQAGIIEKSVQFDGTHNTDYVTFTKTTSGRQTVNVWVYYNSSIQWTNNLLYQSSPRIEFDYRVWNNADNTTKPQIKIGTGSYVTAPNDITENAWHMLTYTWSGGTDTNGVKLYIDGNLVAQGTSNISTTGTGTVYLGRIPTAGNDNSDIKIDEISLWDTNLSASEISELYNSGAGLAYPFPTTPTTQQGYLPNGEAPFFVQWDGNVVSNNVFTVLDQADLNRVKAAGFNGISVDARANFLWTSCTGNPANDFDWDALDDLVAWAEDNDLYIEFQPVYDTGGYIAACIDSNTSYLRASYQNNFPNASPSFTAIPTQISIWDNDLNHIMQYWLGNFASHFADKNQTVVLFHSPPNEGFYNGIMDNNMSPDANYYWQQVYLPSQYATIAALNSDWGTSYAAFTAVPIPTDRTNVKRSNHFWTAKSNRIIEWYVEASKVLKLNAPDTMVSGIKLQGDYFYPNGAGFRTYTHAIDINKYVALAAPWIDFVSLDPYPDQSNISLQATTLDIRYGLAKSIADLYNKPVYVGELFQTVNGGDPETCDEQMFAQMLLQTMAYVGHDVNSGIRGLSIFSWKWSGVGGDSVQSNCLSIRDSNYEDIIQQLAPYVKTIMKEKNLDYNSNLYYYDNTNLNWMNTRQYQNYEQFFGFINATHKIKDYPAQFLLNGSTTSTDNVVYANPIYDYNANIGTWYTWVKNGGVLLTGMRSFDENESFYSEYGAELQRPPISNLLYGNTLTGMFYNIVVPQDYNIVSTKTILTDPAGTKIFSCRAPNTCDSEGASLTTGTAEAQLSGSTSLRLTRNNIGSGTSLHFAFNLYDLIGDNNQTTTTTQMFKDIFDFGGVERRTTTMDNVYGWDSDELAVFNAYGTSVYSFTFDENIPYTILTVDGNVITVNNTSGAGVNINLTSGQALLILKGTELTPPTTTVETELLTDTSTTKVTLTCTDDFSGCAYINFKVDNGDYNSYAVGDNPVELFVTGSGDHTVTYFSTDGEDNNESTQSVSFFVTPDTVYPWLDYVLDSPTGFTNDLNVSFSLTCYDNRLDDINYSVYINDTNLIWSVLDTNATTRESWINISNASETTFKFSCTDLNGNTTTETAPTIYSIQFRLVNEENGTPLTSADFNGSAGMFIKKVYAYDVDGNFSYDFNSTATTITNFVGLTNNLWFEIIYNNAGSDLKIDRKIDFGLIDDSNIAVCVPPLQTFYQQDFTSIGTKQIILYQPSAKCYILAGTTEYIFGSGYKLTTWTINRPYQASTVSNGIKTFLALINGAIENSYNLDAIEFNQQAVQIDIGRDTLAFTPGLADTNTMNIYFKSFDANYTSTTVSIYNGDELLYTLTEDTNANEFALVWVYSDYNITDQNMLKIVVVSVNANEETSTLTEYFNILGDEFIGTKDPSFIAIIVILFFLFGITMMSVGKTFGWFGLIICIASMAMSLIAVQTFWLLMIQGGLFICFLYILLSGGLTNTFGGMR
jgi:hypothetical protein